MAPQVQCGCIQSHRQSVPEVPKYKNQGGCLTSPPRLEYASAYSPQAARVLPRLPLESAGAQHPMRRTTLRREMASDDDLTIVREDEQHVTDGGRNTSGQTEADKRDSTSSDDLIILDDEPAAGIGASARTAARKSTTPATSPATIPATSPARRGRPPKLTGRATTKVARKSPALKTARAASGTGSKASIQRSLPASVPANKRRRTSATSEHQPEQAIPEEAEPLAPEQITPATQTEAVPVGKTEDATCLSSPLQSADDKKYRIIFKRDDLVREYLLSATDSAELIYSDLFGDDISRRLFYEDNKISRFLSIADNGFFPGTNYIYPAEEDRHPLRNHLSLTIQLDQEARNNIELGCTHDQTIRDVLQLLCSRHSVAVDGKHLSINGLLLDGARAIGECLETGDVLDLVEVSIGCFI